MRFIYSVVRFVPDPARGEFINIGAIVGSEESGEWEIQQVANPSRARHLDENGVLDIAWSFINRIGREIDENDKIVNNRQLSFAIAKPKELLSEKWLERLHIDHQNIVQLSPPTPMIATTAQEALEIVFEEMIFEAQKNRQQSYQKKFAAMSAVSAAYKKFGLRDLVKRQVLLHSSRYSETFDFAIVNGRVIQLTNTWSFQRPDQGSLVEEIKAWGWTVKELRNHGGNLSLQDSPQPVPVSSDVDIAVVYVPPVTGSGQTASALDEATGIFEEVKVRFVPLEASEEQVAQIAFRNLAPQQANRSFLQ